MRKKSYNSYNEIEEDILERAFDVDEEMPLPEDYILDEINDKAVEYLRRVGKERDTIEQKHSVSKTLIDFEYSLNVNNTNQFESLYEKLGIKKEWIQQVKDEFETLQLQIKESNSHQKNDIMNFDQVLNKYKLHRDQLPFAIPNDFVVSELAPIITNRLCIKIISHFNRMFLEFHTSGKEKIKSIFLWIYLTLAMLKTPLVDDDSSLLYELNKNILNKGLKHDGVICTQESEENISFKIVFIIISEIFGQKVITNNK